MAAFEIQASRVRPLSGKLYMEHRWGWRRPCRARVSVSAGRRINGPGRLRDVSMSGAFLETIVPLPMFAQIEIAVLCADGTCCAECTGTVVRRELDGVGIEWTEPVTGSICTRLGCGASCPYAEVSG
ncbi:MAG TPA: PilZ domain-containing protein [Steroidobacteraceae bacterium]|nr:PilZ domain-containing protein [Steroidobacteraceae bacterium]